MQDVAAHVISNPQIGWRQLPAVFADAARLGYNEAIFRDVNERIADVHEDHRAGVDGRERVRLAHGLGRRPGPVRSREDPGVGRRGFAGAGGRTLVCWPCEWSIRPGLSVGCERLEPGGGGESLARD